MEKGDLVISQSLKRKGCWGYVENLNYFSSEINVAGFGIPVMEKTEDLIPAEQIEVNSGIFITEEELKKLLSLNGDEQIELMKSYGEKYKVFANNLLGYGLLDTKEIIYTQIVPKKIEHKDVIQNCREFLESMEKQEQEELSTQESEPLDGYGWD